MLIDEKAFIIFNEFTGIRFSFTLYIKPSHCLLAKTFEYQGKHISLPNDRQENTS